MNSTMSSDNLVIVTYERRDALSMQKIARYIRDENPLIRIVKVSPLWDKMMLVMPNGKIGWFRRFADGIKVKLSREDNQKILDFLHERTGVSIVDNEIQVYRDASIHLYHSADGTISIDELLRQFDEEIKRKRNNGEMYTAGVLSFLLDEIKSIIMLEDSSRYSKGL